MASHSRIYVPKCHGYAFGTWMGGSIMGANWAARYRRDGTHELPGRPKIQLLRRRSRDDPSSRQDGWRCNDLTIEMSKRNTATGVRLQNFGSQPKPKGGMQRPRDLNLKRNYTGLLRANPWRFSCFCCWGVFNGQLAVGVSSFSCRRAVFHPLLFPSVPRGTVITTSHLRGPSVPPPTG